MNASLLRSLKPGGRLAVVDFPPRGGVTGPPAARDQGAAHGIQPEVLVTELQAAGFFNVREETWSSPGYFLVVAERPR
jgi:predicted methyltransferase